MRIETHSLLDGAKRAEGIAVVIDVFRAFSTACYAADRGASRIIPVAELERARALKVSNPQYLLVGERRGVPPPDFDYGNSPTQIKEANLERRTVVHTTSAGTKGLVAAENSAAEEVITGSFVNAAAVIKYLKRKKASTVSLIPMGEGGKSPAKEDQLCAQYIERGLREERVPGQEEIKSALKGAGNRFFDPSTDPAQPESDFHLCLEVNKFDFSLRAREREGKIVLNRFELSGGTTPSTE